LGRDSANPNIWYNQGEALANSGCYTEALACFEKAVEIQPHDYGAWVFRGVMLIHLKRYEEALTSCEKALEIQPQDQQAWIFRGVALYYLGRYQEAYDSYNTALGRKQQQGWWQNLRQLITSWSRNLAK
jgi:tetratricopeptide (TPR) repeat protein